MKDWCKDHKPRYTCGNCVDMKDCLSDYDDPICRDFMHKMSVRGTTGGSPPLIQTN